MMIITHSLKMDQALFLKITVLSSRMIYRRRKKEWSRRKRLYSLERTL